ncbi:zinc finger CCCH domain-containing protein 48-like, partial [Trifolium medium]|nr:zinc finger CCCH domain-containing protein 48-like [Trifolium medium]
VVSGIAMPSGSDKLYTGSTDETVRAWDCQSGQVKHVFLFYQTYMWKLGQMLYSYH